MNATTLRDVAKGDYVKRSMTAKAVFIKGDYDRATKSFSLIDTNDCNREVFVKADKTVFIGFEY